MNFIFTAPASLMKTHWEFPGFRVHDTVPDGSCFFSALGHQLLMHSYFDAHKDVKTMRSEILNFIQSKPHLKADICERMTDQNVEQYLLSILSPRTWADHNIITAAAFLYNVKIVIFKYGDAVPTEIGPASSVQKVFLGYVSYNFGEHPTHYVSFISVIGDDVGKTVISMR